MSTLLLKHADLLVTMDAERRRVADGGLFIRDNAIVQAGPTAELPETADTVIDARGMIILPGLVNTHHHLYQTLTRCIAQDSVLFDWLVTLYPIWARLTPEAVYVSAKVGLAELMLSGCTTSSDHLYVYPNGCKIEHEIEAAVDLGIRFTATRGSMSLGRSKGGLPPDSCVEDEAYILKDSQRAIEQYHRRERFGMVHVALAPCSPFSVTGDLMAESAKLARAYGVRLHTHLAETMDEDAFCLEKFGAKPVDYVASLGWIGDDVWHAHCVCLNQDEIALFARTGSGVAHCPSSNMRLASGIAPVRAMRDAGVRVGLGVDGSASNDCNHCWPRRARRCCCSGWVGLRVQPEPRSLARQSRGTRPRSARQRRWRSPPSAAPACSAAMTSARWPPAWPPTSSATGWSGSTSPARCTIRWPRWSSAPRRRWI